MFALILIWGLLMFGLVSLQSHRSSASGHTSPPNHLHSTSITTEVDSLLVGRFTDQNGLSRAENSAIIILAAEVVKIVEDRGFRVEEVIIPQGYLREFNLVMSREATTGDDPDLEPTLQTIQIRCSTTRLATATASDAIHVFDLWLDDEILASHYLDIRTPRRLFYY
ncbi:hypothetical protein FWG86_01025 [Candidatus Saccharibacteria bacterium]|nr:hypothetical protein [Candidatus Saccharibacteria bacterium]